MLDVTESKQQDQVAANILILKFSPSWVHSARLPLNGLLYLPRVIMMMENLVE
jgi:hypothetical protein